MTRGGRRPSEPAGIGENRTVRTFADIPTEIRRRVGAGERVALIFLDAFGLEFLDRHRDHPLVQRLDVTPVRSQVPSTTTAHVTTIHFGLPVEDHGLYEWNVLEPSLGEIICPLRFAPSGSPIEGSLAGRLDPAVLAPGVTLYETLAAPSLVLAPDWIAGSTFSRMATRGAATIAFATLRDGLRALADAVSGSDRIRYAMLYWDQIDLAGHESGPSSDEFAVASRTALDALWAIRTALRDVTVLITADHGQVDVSPETVVYLDELWPELTASLAQPRPAGSSRDAFLHVSEGRVQHVIDGLATRLGDLAAVRPAADLFPAIGDRLAQRLADVAVLPAGGGQVWLRGAAAGERWFRGQHGGLGDSETATYLAQLAD